VKCAGKRGYRRLEAGNARSESDLARSGNSARGGTAEDVPVRVLVDDAIAM
jgi:hypothetical protein